YDGIGPFISDNASALVELIPRIVALETLNHAHDVGCGRVLKCDDLEIVHGFTIDALNEPLDSPHVGSCVGNHQGIGFSSSSEVAAFGYQRAKNTDQLASVDMLDADYVSDHFIAATIFIETGDFVFL